MDMTSTLENIHYQGNHTDKQTAVVSVEQALLQQGDWGSYGNFAKPLAELLPEFTISIEETDDGFTVLMIGPASNQRYEIQFVVSKSDLSIDRDKVVISYEAPPPTFIQE